MLGLMVTLLATRSANAGERHDARVDLDRRAGVAAGLMTAEARRYSDTVTQLAASLGVQQPLTPESFSAICAPLRQARPAGATGVVFVVAAADGHVGSVQAALRSHGAGAVTLAPVGHPAEHFFTVFEQPLDGGKALIGRDLSAAPALNSAFTLARNTRGLVISPMYILLKDRGLPVNQQQPSFVLTAPVYTPSTVPGDPGTLRGWVFVGMRSRDLAMGALKDATQGLVNISLTAAGLSGRNVDVPVIHAGPASSLAAQRVVVPVAQEQWTLTVQDTTRSDHPRSGLGPDDVIAGSGVLLSALAALLTWFVLSARRRALERVQTATRDLRDAEAQARRQAALLEAIMNSISDGVAVVDSSGGLLLYNRAGTQLLGIDSDAPGAGPWQDQYVMYTADGAAPFPPEQMPLVRAVAGQSSDQVDMMIRSPGRPEGVLVSVSGRPLDRAAGVEGGAVAVFHDVTAARRLQADLRDQHDRHEHLLRVLSDLGEGVVIIEEGRIVFANDAYCALTGYTMAELREIDPGSLAFDRADRVTAQSDEADVEPSGDAAAVLLIRLRHHDGHAVPIETTGLTVEHAGRLQRVWVVRDLSDRERVRAELAQRNADLRSANHELALVSKAATAASKAKSDFVAIMSHEIRTPMNAVIGLTGLLLDTELSAQQRDFVETVRDSGDALLVIINEILDFSKIESGGLELEQRPFDLWACVDGAVDLLAAAAAAKGLNLAVCIGTSPRWVVGDVTRLRQVLVNLLGNAVKFTDYGDVLVEVTPQEAELDTEGICLHVAVTDTGIGIPPDRLDRLFESFSQVDSSTTRVYGGTGLGLVICQRLIEAMGGETLVESELGAGSVFSFTVMLGRHEAAEPLAQAPQLRDLQGTRALILADGETSRRVLQQQMESWGAACTLARDPADALGLVARGERYDVAVVDVRPPGVTGAQLAERLRGAGGGAANLPLVLLAAVGELADRPDGVAAVLTKPAKSVPLFEAIVSALAPGSAAPPVPRPREAAPSRTTRLRVLLAEDNLVNQKVGRLLLGKLGHHVDTVGNGREAVQALRQLPYDVVLMDIQMPEMDGLEATRLIRAQLPAQRQPRIVAMTASTLLEDQEACKGAGMDAYLAKPVRAADLAEVLNSQ